MRRCADHGRWLLHVSHGKRAKAYQTDFIAAAQSLLDVLKRCFTASPASPFVSFSVLCNFGNEFILVH